MPLPRELAGRALTTNEMGNRVEFATGDVVVAEYTEAGTRQTTGNVIGDAHAVNELAQRISAHALLGGGEPLPGYKPMPSELTISATATKVDEHHGKKVRKSRQPVKAQEVITKKSSAQPTVESSPLINTILQPYQSSSLRAPDPDPVSPPPIEVAFFTPLGKIRLSTIAVLDGANALTLVFASEADIRYEPAPGTEVQLSVNDRLIDTMYPGFKFTWMDGKLVLMVFVKTKEE